MIKDKKLRSTDLPKLVPTSSIDSLTGTDDARPRLLKRVTKFYYHHHHQSITSVPLASLKLDSESIINTSAGTQPLLSVKEDRKVSWAELDNTFPNRPTGVPKPLHKNRSDTVINHRRNGFEESHNLIKAQLQLNQVKSLDDLNDNKHYLTGSTGSLQRMLSIVNPFEASRSASDSTRSNSEKVNRILKKTSSHDPKLKKSQKINNFFIKCCQKDYVSVKFNSNLKDSQEINTSYCTSMTPNPVWLEEILSNNTKEWLNDDKSASSNQKFKRHSVDICSRVHSHNDRDQVVEYETTFIDLTDPQVSNPDEMIEFEANQTHSDIQFKDSTILSCTPKRLVELMLLSGSELVTDIFLTYRHFLTPLNLCQLIEARFFWALGGDTSSQMVTRVRTFIIVRHWVNHYYDYDFVPSPELRTAMGSFLDRAGSHPMVINYEPNLRIVCQMRRCLRRQSEFYAHKKISEGWHQSSLENLTDRLTINTPITSTERYSYLHKQRSISTITLSSSSQTVRESITSESRDSILSRFKAELVSGESNDKSEEEKMANESLEEFLSDDDTYEITFPEDEPGSQSYLDSHQKPGPPLAFKSKVTKNNPKVMGFFKQLRARAVSMGSGSLKAKYQPSIKKETVPTDPVKAINELPLPFLPTSPTVLRSRSVIKDLYHHANSMEFLSRDDHPIGGLILKFPPELIARQFCIIEQKLLSKIEWSELVGWGSESKEGKHISSAVDRFNITCQWVASVILTCRHLEDRVEVIERLIHITWWCHFHRNFATLLQLLLGLQCGAVARLKKTWSLISTVNMKLFNGLLPYSVPLRNWRHLRQATDLALNLTSSQLPLAPPTLISTTVIRSDHPELISRPPQTMPLTASPHHHGSIPFLGLFLSDLVFNSELSNTVTTSPSTPSPQTPLVNFRKFQRIAKIIRQLWQFQSLAEAGYTNFPRHPHLYPHLVTLPYLSPRQINRLSFAYEP